MATAVLIHALLFFNSQPELVPDSHLYLAQAQSLATTGSARNALGEPDTVVTPGYPVFLAAFLAGGLGLTGAVAVQRALWILVVAATTWLSFRLTGRAAIAVVAGMIVAADIVGIQAAGAILSDTLATLFVGGAAWCAYLSTRERGSAMASVAGVLAGAAALVRPVATLLGAIFALAIMISGMKASRRRAAVTLLTASVLVIAPWTVRNYAQTGVMTFSSLGSINLLRYRAAGTLAIRDAGGLDANLPRRQAELEAAACRIAEQRFGLPCVAISITRRATVYGGVALPIIFGDPVATAQQAARAFVMIMFGGGANVIARTTGISESAARFAALIYTVPLALLALIGVPHWWKHDRAAATVMLLTVSYLILVPLGAEAYSRFRVPFLPFYAMLAAGGFAAICKRV